MGEARKGLKKTLLSEPGNQVGKNEGIGKGERERVHRKESWEGRLS